MSSSNLPVKSGAVLVIDGGTLLNYVHHADGKRFSYDLGPRRLLDNLEQRLGYRFQHKHYFDAVREPQTSEVRKLLLQVRTFLSYMSAVSSSSQFGKC